MYNFDSLSPLLKDLLELHYRFFLITESKYATLVGSRKYRYLNIMTESFSTAFINHFYNIPYKAENDPYNNFSNTVYDIQKDFVGKAIPLLHKNNPKYQDIAEEFQRIFSENNLHAIKDKIVRNKGLIKKITGHDNTPEPQKKIEQPPRKCDYKNLDMLVKVFDVTHYILNKIIQFLENKSYTSSQSIKPVIIEYGNFIAHFSFAYQAYASEQLQGADYINTNLLRGKRHLERAVLDAYKIIFANLASTGKLLTPVELSNLLDTRQAEINGLCNSFENKVCSYIQLLFKICSIEHLDLKNKTPFMEEVLAEFECAEWTIIH